MAKRPVGRPRKSAKTKKKAELGKASSLPGKLWGAWLDHVLAHGSMPWLWVALVLSHCFCLRITEVMKLRKRDFLWQLSGSACWRSQTSITRAQDHDFCSTSIAELYAMQMQEALSQ